MAFWNESRGLDEFVKSGDRTLNVLVIVLLAAFALGSAAYYYGQMNPRVVPVASSQAPAASPSPAAPAPR